MNGQIRKGQQAFNILAEKDPEIAELIRGGPHDPYYDDSRIGAFQQQVVRLRRERAVQEAGG